MFALLSVSDKTGLVELADRIIETGYQIIATGGTFKTLRDAPLLQTKQHAIFTVESLTRHAEILGGRVKTLHPSICGGILYDRENPKHVKEAIMQKLPDIRLVVVNLYPFWKLDLETVKDKDAIEQIDIGGVTLLRAAAKNFKDVTVLSRHEQYDLFPDAIDVDMRRRLAYEAFRQTTNYDKDIALYFSPAGLNEPKLPPLKYGCNPHQTPALMKSIQGHEPRLKLLNGEWGFINVLDAINAFSVVSDLSHLFPQQVAASSFKHTNPAGVALSKDWKSLPPASQQLLGKLYGLSNETTPSVNAYARARNADPQASFGDFIGFSGRVDVPLAEFIAKQISDGIVASSFEPEALDILKQKKKGKFVIIAASKRDNFIDEPDAMESREFKAFGVMLSQPLNQRLVTVHDLIRNIPTRVKEIPPESMFDLVIANTAMKYAQSNNVACAAQGQLIACAAGQQSRIGAVTLVQGNVQRWINRHNPDLIEMLDQIEGTRQEKIIATTQAAETRKWCDEKMVGDISLASDAFFPFADNIEKAVLIPVKYISQPGGSARDEEVIKACDEHNIAMSMTGIRIFTH